MLPQSSINALFAPNSIAVIGDFCISGGVAGRTVANLISASFAGNIFPVNISPCSDGNLVPGSLLEEAGYTGPVVLGSISAIPEAFCPLDLAIICLPPEETPAMLREVSIIGVKAVVVTSPGFGETGAVGTRLEEELLTIAQKNGIALLGPGSSGFIRPASGIHLAFGQGKVKAGGIGFFSHSRSVCSDVLDWQRISGIGFSSVVHLGNRVMLDEADMLAYFANDPDTKVILGYLETIPNGTKFLEQAHLATRKKPVIIMRPGRSPEGARAVSAHSGAVPSLDIAYEAAFRQTGIIRAERVQDFLAMAHTFSSGFLPKGPGLAVVTNSGAAGIISADACSQSSLCLSALAQETLSALRAILPSYAAIYNPIETTDDADASVLANTAAVVLADPAVHSLLLIVTGSSSVDLSELARLMTETTKSAQKPVVLCIMRGDMGTETLQDLAGASLHSVYFPDAAVGALACMYKYSLWQKSPLPVDVYYRHDQGRAERIIDAALAEGRVDLTEYQAMDLLKAYEMPVVEAKLARTSNEAVQIAKQIGGAVSLRIASPHSVGLASERLELDSVVSNLDTADKVRKAFMDLTGQAMRLHKEAYIAGCVVQACPPPNCREVIIGFKRDKQFGPVVYFGVAGHVPPDSSDLSCRLAPLALSDAPAMVRENPHFPRLVGTKGQAAIKFTALEDTLLILSSLAEDCPEIIEAECEPVLVNETGAWVVGLRVSLARGNGVASLK